jgi:tRNA pseudouridine38-40 synthase
VNEPVGPPDVPDRRARFVVAYDGAHFKGFARTPGEATVQGSLETALTLIARRPVAVTGAGRTDAGVHGWGQVVSADLPGGLKMREVVKRLNGLCGPHVAVRTGEWVAADFDARFSAQWRHYRYHVLNSATPNPLMDERVWHVRAPLNLALMQLACDPLIGEHDFSSFCRKPQPGPGPVERSLRRRVLLARWSSVADDHLGPDDRLLRFEIRANAFCHQMVRSIVGTLVDVGTGKIHAGDIRGILAARHRNAAGAVAPPQGLCLWQVGYPPAEPTRPD